MVLTLEAVDAQLARVEPFVRRWLRPVLWALVIVPLPALFALFFLGQLGAEPVEAAEKYTGEWVLRFLAGSLAVTPLIRLTGWGWLIPERRFLGLAAFFWSLGHLSVYTGVDKFFDVSDIVEDVLKHLYVTVGMLGVLLMVPLAITSTKGWITRLGGRRWNQLHKLAYAAAVAGCIHYIWAQKKDIQEPLVYAAVFVALFALRFVLPKHRVRRPLTLQRA